MTLPRQRKGNGLRDGVSIVGASIGGSEMRVIDGFGRLYVVSNEFGRPFALVRADSSDQALEATIDQTPGEPFDPTWHNGEDEAYNNCGEIVDIEYWRVAEFSHYRGEPIRIRAEYYCLAMSNFVSAEVQADAVSTCYCAECRLVRIVKREVKRLGVTARGARYVLEDLALEYRDLEV